MCSFEAGIRCLSHATLCHLSVATPCQTGAENKFFAKGAKLTGAVFRLEAQGTILRLLAEGDWSTAHVAAIDADLREIVVPKAGHGELVLDLNGVTRLDTSGAHVLNRTAAALQAQGLVPRYDGMKPEQRLLIEKIEALEKFKAERTKRRPASIAVAPPG